MRLHARMQLPELSTFHICVEMARTQHSIHFVIALCIDIHMYIYVHVIT